MKETDGILDADRNIRLVKDKMKISIQDIISGMKFRRRNIPGQENRKESDTNQRVGIIYSVWLFILPLIAGLVFGYLADSGISYALGKFSDTSGMNDSSVAGSQASGESGKEKRTLDEFLTVNPFRISPIKPVVAEAPKPVEEPEPQPQDTTLDNLILRGTMPGIGIWYEQDGKLDILLIRKTIGSYRLSAVKPREAVFMKDRKRIVKYITYGPVAAQPKETPKPKPAPAPAQRNNNSDQIVAASESQEGQISSEMVNQLIQNPFDELKRIRLTPSETAGGLKVEWIQSDSILKRLGVQKGDVIRSVNGIPFTNMGDIANSISSLMNSERFDVEVTRGDKAAALRYVVK